MNEVWWQRIVGGEVVEKVAGEGTESIIYCACTL